jgi:hypothetical protein
MRDTSMRGGGTPGSRWRQTAAPKQKALNKTRELEIWRREGARPSVLEHGRTGGTDPPTLFSSKLRPIGGCKIGGPPPTPTNEGGGP